jgi:hypothetical protein
MGKPICIDLYCGLGGWSEGFLTEGYECIGYDIEAHDYGTGVYPGELRIRDVRSIHGSELKDATCIVGSSPCQEFSYRAMPWKRAKALPPPYLGIELFNAQFRIQREAIEAAGHYIPMVVENVRGAQKWVGQARYHYGSFYLWGDVPALMPSTFNIRTSKTPPGNGAGAPLWKDRKLNSLSHATMTDDSREWYGFEDGRKHDGSGWTEKGSLKSHNRLVANTGVKVGGSGAAWFREPLQAKRREATAIKNGGDWFGAGENCSLQRRASSKSSSRKAASAMIAKIPFALAQHIARTFKPVKLELVSNA